MFSALTADTMMPCLGDLEPSIYEIGVSCDRCWRTVTFGVDELRGRHSRGTRALEITGRMRCTDCGHRGLTASLRLR